MKTRKINVTNVQECAKALNLIDRFVSEEGSATIVVSDLEDKRSEDQNALLNAWYAEISQFLGDTPPHEVRRYCKYYLGLPIFETSNKSSREYAAGIRFLLSPIQPGMVKGEYKTKEQREINAMKMFQVSSVMSKKEMGEYLDAIEMHYAAQGLVLVSPSEEQMMDYPEVQR